MRKLQYGLAAWGVAVSLLAGCMAEQHDGVEAPRPTDVIDPADSYPGEPPDAEPWKFDPADLPEPSPPDADAPPDLDSTDISPLRVPHRAWPDEPSPDPVPVRSFNPMREVDVEALAPMADPPDSPIAEVPGPAPGNAEPLAGDAYTVVRVYYGTDRNALTLGGGSSPRIGGWFALTAGAAAAALFLAAAALRLPGKQRLRWAALGAVACTVILGGWTLFAGMHQPAPAAADESPAAARTAYGNQRGTMEYGICEVSIPRSHKVGHLEAPSIFRLDFRESPERHVVLMGVEPLESERFFESLKGRVAQSDSRSAFVFVHGFNVTFEDAARRTAQIAYDLRFDGAPILFSWPSQGGLFKYTIDETNVMWTVPHLREFLTQVAERTGARRIHLVAHSMGNRALTSALRDLSFLPEAKRPRFNEVVLTAPDIDAEVFRKDIAPYIVQTADRVTLYASSNDTALAYSKTVHGYPRAGDSGRELLVMPGMETVDVSEVDTSLLGHNYYGSNETVLADLIEVLQRSMPPQQRRWLRPARVGALEYWVFQR